MIANLPAKRTTRRVIQFKEDEIKTRSQATMASVSYEICTGYVPQLFALPNFWCPPNEWVVVLFMWKMPLSQHVWSWCVTDFLFLCSYGLKIEWTCLSSFICTYPFGFKCCVLHGLFQKGLQGLCKWEKFSLIINVLDILSWWSKLLNFVRILVWLDLPVNYQHKSPHSWFAIYSIGKH